MTPRVVALAAAVTVAACAPRAAAQAPAPAVPVRLSDEQAFTRSANAVTPAPVRAQPSARAVPVGRLRLLTEDGYPEVYVALSALRAASGLTWVRVRVPQRPNGITGWVPADALGPFSLVRTRIVVDTRALRVTLYDRGRRRFSARVGVGAPGTPTPRGSFWIREKFPVSGVPLYGTRAMGTSAYSSVLTDWPGGGVVGLHGTSEPGLIPGRPSHGCVRLRNADIERLFALTPVGTPLRIE